MAVASSEKRPGCSLPFTVFFPPVAVVVVAYSNGGGRKGERVWCGVCGVCGVCGACGCE